MEFSCESKSAKLLVDPLQLVEYFSRVAQRRVLETNNNREINYERDEIEFFLLQVWSFVIDSGLHSLLSRRHGCNIGIGLDE